ncbi:MAG: hypothetical protein PG981_000337 [Wolbachia endosymbiont of Ctenocephalides orientis wCori]|nr:MAG: hypothetical protein PG981_000337 [Wolbachia endosymbiont of Ctenocephalides orientis wCori]
MLNSRKLSGLNIERILSNQEAVIRLNSITNEDRLTCMLNSRKFNNWDIERILSSQEAFNGLNYINEDQLIFLLDSEKICQL